MPIFMDRHDVSESVTAELIAQLHQEDLKVQHHFGCRGLTYWFDDKRKTAFCLIEAPDAGAIQKMHDIAHGQVPNTIIEVETSIVEAFLGRIGDPEKAQNIGLNIINDPAFRTIMVISFKRAAPDFHPVINEVLDAYKGNRVKQTDGNYLVSFVSVSNAVDAALKIRLLFKDFSKHSANDELILKIGLSAGVPVTQKKLIFEDSIKLAERMCEIVKGEIILSAEVRDLYKSENAATFKEGETVLSLTRADEKFLTLLMDYAEVSWSNTDLKVDDFSKPTGCSKSQLYRKLTLLTGHSPNSFIREYRLKEAMKLLSKKAGNISEIAFETGFSSPSYFSKCFLKKYGCLPSDAI